MKKTSFLPLAVSLMLVLVLLALGACKPEAAPTPTPTPTPAPPAEKVTWKFQSYAGHVNDQWTPRYLIQNMFPRIKERTNGNFIIKEYWYGELGVAPDNFPTAVGAGVIDMAISASGYYQGSIPLMAPLDMIYMTMNPTQTGIMSDIVRPIAAEEYMKQFGAKLLTSQPYSVCMAQMGKPFPSLTDWSGVKVREVGRWLQMAELLGGTTTYVPWAEMYPSIQRGVMDGVFTDSDASCGSKLYEVLTHVYLYNPDSGDWQVLVSPESLDALPTEYRTIFLEEAERAFKEMWDLVIPVDRVLLAAIEFWKSKGIEVVVVPDDIRYQQREIFRDALWQVWADETGPEAQSLLDDILAATEGQGMEYEEMYKVGTPLPGYPGKEWVK